MPAGSELLLLGKGIGILFFFLLAAYFIPAIVARIRDHHNAAAITVLNLLLGWTILGWVVALVWAVAVPLPGQRERSERYESHDG